MEISQAITPIIPITQTYPADELPAGCVLIFDDSKVLHGDFGELSGWISEYNIRKYAPEFERLRPPNNDGCYYAKNNGSG